MQMQLIAYWGLFLAVFAGRSSSDWLAELNLPPKLLEYTVRNYPQLKSRCLSDHKCKKTMEEVLENGRCFGHEPQCAPNLTYSAEFGFPKCRRNINPKSRETFTRQADFVGYLGDRFVDQVICPSTDDSALSSLKCSENLEHCFATNIFFDFSNLKAPTSKRYRDDVIGEGQVGGNCGEFRSEVLGRNQASKGYLTNWVNELKHFQSYPDFTVDSRHCDVIFERPTVVIKLDAAVNMYHHFCDFINLYASLHLNQSFGMHFDVVWWDTTYQSAGILSLHLKEGIKDARGFNDLLFGSTWKAFTNRKPIELLSLDGKKVCFRNVLLPLLARQYAGLFYNMPLEPGCSGSGLVHAFVEHVLHRLRIPAWKPLGADVRVVLLSRSTHYRRIHNIADLAAAVDGLPNVTASVVDYNEKMPFLSQLNATTQADVFVGIHGAGLTHLLFLPDWAAVFEVYHCEDRGCYSDLARLRGIKYFTWPDAKLDEVKPDAEGRHPSTGERHAKFTNYRVDVDAFVEHIRKLVEYVRRHPKFVAERRKVRREQLRSEL